MDGSSVFINGPQKRFQIDDFLYSKRSIGTGIRIVHVLVNSKQSAYVVVRVRVTIGGRHEGDVVVDTVGTGSGTGALSPAVLPHSSKDQYDVHCPHSTKAQKTHKIEPLVKNKM